MDIMEAVYKILKNNKGITKYVESKIYPVIIPQSTILPAICYSPVIANYDSALQGDTGYARQTVQITTHAKTFKETRTISRLVKGAFQDYKGKIGSLSIEAVFIKSDYDVNGNSSLKFNEDEYMNSIEFEIHFNETKEEK